MKIASYIQNGKRYDIVLPEIEKGVMIPLPFSKGGNLKPEDLIIKGGPGSGRYPEGSGKEGKDIGFKEGDTVIASKTSKEGIPEFDGAWEVVGRDGDNYVIENKRGYQQTVSSDRIEAPKPEPEYDAEKAEEKNKAALDSAGPATLKGHGDITGKIIEHPEKGPLTITGMKQGAVRPVYAVQDKSGKKEWREEWWIKEQLGKEKGKRS